LASNDFSDAGIFASLNALAGKAPLGHAGRWLTDAAGRVVILRGFNMVNKLPPYHPAALGFGADDAAFLREHGFNTVRLGIIWKALEPEPGSYDDGYLDQIAATVEALGRESQYVLLDFHQDMYNERFNGEGAPDWAVQDDGLPAWPDVGFPGNYAVMPALWRAYDHFWANDPGPGGVGLQDRYAAAWRHVARRFRDESAVLGYDIFNEPFPGSRSALCLRPRGCPGFDRRLTEFSLRVVRAIREVDDRKLVFYEPNVLFDYGADTHHGDLADTGAGFSFHVYCAAASPGVPSLPRSVQDRICGRQEQRVFDLAERHAHRTGTALLLSEFGATDDLAALSRTVELADRNMMSWQYWAYFGRDPCCARPEEGLVWDPAKPPAGGNLKEDKLAVLERPYPRAVAGTPERFRFENRARAFELVYTTSAPGAESLSPDAETEIYVPDRHYGSGYRTEVSGARIASGSGERVFRLVNLPEADRVVARVLPA
jgi:endoglycosylceramidase